MPGRTSRRAPARRPTARRRSPKPDPQPRLEAILSRQGYRYVAGVDEVGRGALAGPLVAAAVLLDTADLPDGVCDSKVLTASEREACAVEVLSVAVAVSYAVVDACDIDDEGLHVTNLQALVRAVRSLRPEPEYVISDCFPLAGAGLPHVGLPKADALSAAVGAASIVAKVARDAYMSELDREHPGYGFARHKGYGTAEHWTAIRSLGPSPVHRRSFRGVGSYQPSFLDV
ncbi:MAG TPA: ribonuclease HII [Actinomycetota bacterium]|nr:ribonuclease HII [Actinomycetota bacterium]